MILIFSESGDTVTNTVIDWINFYEKEYIRVNEKDVITINNLYFKDRIMNFNITIKEYQGNKIHKLDLSSISGYWFRRLEPIIEMNYLSDDNLLSSSINRNYLYYENYKLKMFLHDFLVQRKHINSIFDTKINKLTTLLLAQKYNIDIPETIVSKEKKEVLKKLNGKIITKGIYDNGCILTESIGAGCYTKLLETDNLSEISDTFEYSLFQNYIEKEFEIRTFFLHDAFFSMAIFSQQNSNTSIDYRAEKYSNESLRMCPYQLPRNLEEKLSNLLSDLNLNCASIDIIKESDGNFVLLEINPLGQFEFLGRPCNYNLENEIAKILIK